MVSVKNNTQNTKRPTLLIRILSSEISLGKLNLSTTSKAGSPPLFSKVTFIVKVFLPKRNVLN